MLKNINKTKTNITLISDSMMFSDGLDTSIEIKEDINNIFNRLEQKDTEILILKYYVDLTLQQIAGILGLNISSTKVRLHRAKGKFRALIENDLKT